MWLVLSRQHLKSGFKVYARSFFRYYSVISDLISNLFFDFFRSRLQIEVIAFGYFESVPRIGQHLNVIDNENKSRTETDIERLS